MITISVTNNLGELQNRLIISRDIWANWGPFFDAWAEAWRASRAEMFETSGASIGHPWPMYSRKTNEHRYAAVKAKMFGRRMTRKDLLTWIEGSEVLRPSFSDKSAPHNVDEKSNEEITVGSSVPYAINHDQGQGRMPVWAGGFKIPQRRLLDFGEALESSTAEMLSAFAGAGIDGLGDRIGLTTDEVYELINGGSAWQ